MLSSITPLGERGRGNRFGIAASAHVVGSTLGGIVIGVLAGAMGGAVRLVTGGWSARVALSAIALAALAAAFLDLVVRPSRLPCWRRQVNELWLDEYRPWVYAGGFGFQLGMGVVTIVTSAVTYAWLVATMAQPGWWNAVVVGATFGLVRGASILLVSRVDRPARLLAAHQTFARIARPAALGAGVGVGIVGSIAMGVVVLSGAGA